MGAEVVGRNMPAQVSLDDLTAMMAADPHGHRYELSPEGFLSVMPPPDSEHAVIATRLMFWLAAAGWPAEQVLQVPGLRIPGRDGGVGGRIPDLTVWSGPQPRAVWLPTDDLLLAVEIVSPGSEGADTVTKLREYAAAGVARYWVVARDDGQTVTMYELDGDDYRLLDKMPLNRLLGTAPAEHLG